MRHLLTFHIQRRQGLLNNNVHPGVQKQSKTETRTTGSAKPAAGTVTSTSASRLRFS